MPPISRRTFVRTIIRSSLALGVAGVSGSSYARYAEPYWLSVDQLDVPMANLPASLNGLRIAQISDLHAGPHMTPHQIEEAVASVQQAGPDMIVLTGDYVSGPATELVPLLPLLARLDAPLGVYAVLGNHDHWSKRPAWITRQLAQIGIQVLRNANLAVPTGRGELWLAGVDDVMVGKANLETALAGIPAGSATILLAHEPDYADHSARVGITLQLSGHSHGGQVRLPLLGAPILPALGQRYPIGLQRVAGQPALVYTNRGLGMVEPAVRFNCRPEVTVLRLRSGV